MDGIQEGRIPKKRPRQETSPERTSAKSPRNGEYPSSSTRFDRKVVEVAGRLIKVELENFMCHGNLKVNFDIHNKNCFYVGGPNGSGKSALFSAINIGLGGAGRQNDRGNSVKTYIKDGKSSAKVRVILSNTGEGSDPQYGDSITIERRITETSSTYTLKSTRNTGSGTQSIVGKKREVDILLARFGIELNNPVYWLSQDRARSFLASTNPKKLYQIFMDASELETTKQQYDKLKDIIDALDSNLTRYQETLEDRKRKIRELRRIAERGLKCQSLHDEIQKLQLYSVFVSLRDAQNEQKLHEAKLTAIKENQRRLTQMQRDTAEEIQDYRLKLEEMADKTGREKAKLEAAQQHLRDYEDTMLPVKMAINGLRKKIHDLEQIISNNADDIKQTAHRILVEEQRLCQTDKDEIDRLKKSIEDYSKRMPQLSGQLEQTKADLEKSNENLKSIHGSRKEEYKLVTQYRGECYDLQKELQFLRDTQKNRLAAFGPETPQYIALIQNNISRFRKPPKGPLGSLISLNNPKWALAVEQCLRSFLHTFIFDSHEDEALFRTLVQQNRLRTPHTTVIRFNSQPYDTRRFEPPGEYYTVLRVLQIKDIDVKNALVDLANIESIVLFENDKDARDVMDGHAPRNGNIGFTASGAQVYGSSGTKGTYRIYACYQKKANILTESVENRNPEELRRMLETQEQKRKIAEEKYNECSSKFEQKRIEVGNLSTKIESLERDLSIINRKIQLDKRKLEKEMEKKDGTSQLKADKQLLQEYNAFKIEKKEELKTAELEQKRNFKIYNKMEEECIKFKKDVETKLDEHKHFEDIAFGYKNKIDRCVEAERKFNAGMKSLEDDEEKLNNVERVQILRKIDEAKALADEYCKEHNVQPPNFQDIPRSEALCELLRKKQNELESINREVKHSRSQETLSQITKTFEKARDSWLTYNQIRIALHECYEIRKAKYPIIRYAICSKLKMEFMRLIKFKFPGQLKINHEQRSITLQIRPHSENSDDLKDIRGLSGGERSYTTTCFFMALWQIMETPFRCMDEFDVFMDGQMRSTAMDLIVNLATSRYAHQQFIFFTPQGINELKSDDRVAVFEMPKVRE